MGDAAPLESAPDHAAPRANTGQYEQTVEVPSKFDDVDVSKALPPPAPLSARPAAPAGSPESEKLIRPLVGISIDWDG